MYLEAGMVTTRYWANDSRKKLTGRDFGFIWNDPKQKRDKAVKRWCKWYSQQPKLQQPQISENMPPGKVSLFDGTNLGQWKTTDFRGHGNVYIKDESIILQTGDSLTGVTWAGPLLRMNYEINLDAMRLDGGDFFCGLTFPVGDACVTFVVGGWGGAVCGISCINFYDASDNETTTRCYLDNNVWYHIRVRVTPDRIQCWIDDEQYVDLETAGKHLDIRFEVKKSKPLGIASWRTAAAVKNIRLTKLPDAPSVLSACRPTR
jgi:hypothetical protein